MTKARAIHFLCSTIGKKYLMGLTGLVWMGFVAAHMAGNLLIFVSADAYNSYGHALTSGNIIYIAETVLILALLSHIYLAIRLTMENRRARPIAYKVKPSGGEKDTNWYAKTMAIHGTLILFFIVSHLITFKYGANYRTTIDGVEMRDLFRLIVEEFHEPGLLAWYFVALIFLLFHLRHGASSVFQSFGLLHPAYQPLIKKFALAYAVIVVGGFMSQPIFVYFFK